MSEGLPSLTHETLDKNGLGWEWSTPLITPENRYTKTPWQILTIQSVGIIQQENPSLFNSSLIGYLVQWRKKWWRRPIVIYPVISLYQGAINWPYSCSKMFITVETSITHIHWGVSQYSFPSTFLSLEKSSFSAAAAATVPSHFRFVF